MRLPLMLLLIVAFLILAGLGYGVWYITRPQPAPLPRQMLFPGIWYTREVRQSPVAQIIHIIEIDLNTPGMHFRVTPHAERSDYVYSAQTTSQFLSDKGLSLAINGDYFDPAYDRSILYSYPHTGDGINIHGYTVSEGKVVDEGYAAKSNMYPSLYIDAENQASFEPVENAFNVISGNLRIVTEGRIAPRLYTMPVYLVRQPRSGLALTQDNSHLLMVVVDGRQPNYSDGASLLELASILIEHGGYTGLNLDGGGSSTLVVRDIEGQPSILNSPIHNRIPGRERPVANHLGIWFKTPES